jgi:3-hydroxyacyl-CoA dehydrogenase
MAIRTVAVVGTGVIGASWATHFLVRGLDVVAADPAPGAEQRLRAFVAERWDSAAALGLAAGASSERLRFVAGAAEAVRGADFVQESGPERLDLKQALYREMDAAARPGVVLATSSSGILVSQIQSACAEPGRVLVGHPFNPPHLIPLVEVVGGEATSAEAVAAALAFYRAVGKHPIHVKKEVRGHIANRLQAALWREAFGLVHSGVATAADIDAAIAHGPGLRWALLGPFLNMHLSGGAGGMQHFLHHLGPPIQDWWRDLYDGAITEALAADVLASVAAETAAMDLPAAVRERDRLLVDLLAAKAAATDLP